MSKGNRAGESAIAVEVEKDKSYYWCSCGKSSKQPFCDGSHKGTEFTPLSVQSSMRQKECSFVLANKLAISHFVMDHTINNKRIKCRI